MAVDATDRFDAASRLPLARTAAQSGDRSGDRFGEALTAAHRQADEAARSRSTLARQDADRQDADRQASDREATRQQDRREADRADAVAERRAAAQASGPTDRTARAAASGAETAAAPAGDRPPAAAPAEAAAKAGPEQDSPAPGSAATKAVPPSGEASSAAADPATAGAQAQAGEAAKSVSDHAETKHGGGETVSTAAGTPAGILSLLAVQAAGPAAATAEGSQPGTSVEATAGPGAPQVGAPGAPGSSPVADDRARIEGLELREVEGGHAGSRAAGAEKPVDDALAILGNAGDPQTADPGAVASTAAAQAGPGTPAAAGPAATPAAPAAAPAPAAPPVPIGQVPMTIGLRSLAGSSEFQIRLDPAELGRIEVKLAIDKAHGTVMTRLVVDRPETLALLQRDAGQLQQALSQAGLDPSGGGLSLSLRSDGDRGGDARGDGSSGGGTAGPADPAEAVQEVAPRRALRGYGGLDIRI